MKKTILGILCILILTGILEARQNRQTKNVPKVGIDVPMDPS